MINTVKNSRYLWKIVNWFNKPISEKAKSIIWNYLDLRSYLFEKKYSLDFKGDIPNTEIVTESKSSILNSLGYQAISTYSFIILMEEAIKILAERPQNYFIDIGCGKGKPCIYAKKYFKFKQIIGIDFSKPLIDTANKNLKNTQYTNIVFTVADGVEWKLPDEFCVVFLHNPFNGIILEKFIVNNLNNFRLYACEGRG